MKKDYQKNAVSATPPMLPEAVSIVMAELSLLPAVRRAEMSTLVVADGTSCRHQIADGTGRSALHVAQVLALSLDRATPNSATAPATKDNIHG